MGPPGPITGCIKSQPAVLTYDVPMYWPWERGLHGGAWAQARRMCGEKHGGKPAERSRARDWGQDGSSKGFSDYRRPLWSPQSTRDRPTQLPSALPPVGLLSVVPTAAWFSVTPFPGRGLDGNV